MIDFFATNYLFVPLYKTLISSDTPDWALSLMSLNESAQSLVIV